MPFKIYNRFEVQHELSNDAGNRIYEAYDTTTNSEVHLFQWTPSLIESNLLSDTAAKVQAELDPPAELFSDHFSFYLSAKPESAKRHLQTLRRYDLFTGHWTDYFSAKPPSESKTEQQPVLGLTAPTPKTTKRWIAAGIIFGLATVALSALAVYQSVESNSKSEQITSLSQNLDQLQTANNGLKSNLDQAYANLHSQKPAYRHLEASATQAVDTIFKRGEEELDGDSLLKRWLVIPKPLIIRHCGLSHVNLAIHYQSRMGLWVTRGWFDLNPGQTLTLPAYSPEFYIVEHDDKITWSRPDARRFGVLLDRPSFLIGDQIPSIGVSPRTVSMHKASATFYLGTCPTKN